MSVIRTYPWYSGTGNFTFTGKTLFLVFTVLFLFCSAGVTGSLPVQYASGAGYYQDTADEVIRVDQDGRKHHKLSLRHKVSKNFIRKSGESVLPGRVAFPSFRNDGLAGYSAPALKPGYYLFLFRLTPF